MLRNAMINRSSVTTIFNNKDDILDDTIKKELVKKLKKGDREAADLIIKGHINLVISIATRYINRYPNKEEDLIGEALLTLCKCVSRIRRGHALEEHTNITGYINICVAGHLHNYVATDFLIKRPLNSDWIIFKIQKYGTESIERLFQCVSIDGLDFILTIDRDITKEILESRVFTQVELSIIRYRLDEYTDAEIAEFMSMSRSNVRKIRHKLRDRIYRILEKT